MKYPSTGSQTHPGAHRVAGMLLEHGPATASELGAQLNLTGTAIRRHLDNLVEAGFAEASDRAPFGPLSSKPRGRGRPAKVYSLTPTGQEFFDQAYDDLAISALRFLRDGGGSDAIADFARDRALEMERRYAQAVSGGTTVEQRAALLAEALRADGFASGVESAGNGGIQVCQHHCPVVRVAQEFPELCEAEAQSFARLVGTHVTRLATLSQGDGVCTTHIPRPVDQPGDPGSTTGSTIEMPEQERSSA